MSLLIDVDKVRAVLLIDGWHFVDNESFELDSYEFCCGDGSKMSQMRLGGGQEPLISAIGARWIERTSSPNSIESPDLVVLVYCPLTSVLAVKEQVPTEWK